MIRISKKSLKNNRTCSEETSNDIHLKDEDDYGKECCSDDECESDKEDWAED